MVVLAWAGAGCRPPVVIPTLILALVLALAPVLAAARADMQGVVPTERGRGRGQRAWDRALPLLAWRGGEAAGMTAV